VLLTSNTKSHIKYGGERVNNYHISYCFMLFSSAAPTIKHDNKYDDTLSVKAGNLVIIEVDITGEPKPKVTWACNGNILSSSADIIIETTHDSSTLNVKRSSAKNAGKYTVTAVNEVGTATDEFAVKVIGM